MKNYVIFCLLFFSLSFCNQNNERDFKKAKYNSDFSEAYCDNCYNGCYDNLDTAILNFEKVNFILIHRKEYRIFPIEITKMRHLKEISIYNQHSLDWNDTFEKLCCLDSLNKLTIENCKIGNLTNIRKLKYLKELIIIDSAINMFPIGITNCSSLEDLVIYSPIQTIPNNLEKLVNLKRLTITLKKSEFPSELLSLINLEELNLAGSSINSISLEIGKLKKLKELWIYDTGITKDIDSFYIAANEFQKKLKIKRKRDKEIKELEKLLKGCKIYLDQPLPPL
jgi:hypothetical protein